MLITSTNAHYINVECLVLNWSLLYFRIGLCHRILVYQLHHARARERAEPQGYVEYAVVVPPSIPEGSQDEEEKAPAGHCKFISRRISTNHISATLRNSQTRQERRSLRRQR